MCCSLSFNLVQASHTDLKGTTSFLELLERTERNFRPEREKKRFEEKEKE